jgi:hypothetical protein
MSLHLKKNILQFTIEALWATHEFIKPFCSLLITIMRLFYNGKYLHCSQNLTHHFGKSEKKLIIVNT